LQLELHETFIDHVKSSRGDRLQDHPELFTGAFWTGNKSVELGLADGIGHLVPKMKELYRRQDPFRRLRPEAQRTWPFRPVAGFRAGHRTGGTRGLRAVRPVLMLKIVIAVSDLHGRARHVRQITPAQDHPPSGRLAEASLLQAMRTVQTAWRDLRAM
jgi:ClpP class serine protease